MDFEIEIECFGSYGIFEQETQKFRAELLKRLLKEKEIFGDDLDNVVQVCVEVFLPFFPFFFFFWLHPKYLD